MRKLLIGTALVASCFAVACASKAQPGSTENTGVSNNGDVSNTDSGDSTEASNSAGQVSDVEQTIFSPVQSQDPAAAASSVAAAQWWPAGCATRTRDASNPLVVHVHLDNCTGPFGIRKHTGDITVTFSKNGDGSLHAEATSANMTINDKPVTFSASRDITLASGIIDVKGHAAWTRVNAAGDTVSHTTAVETQIDVKARCRESNGTAVTRVGSREIDSTIKDYKICREADGTDGCPSGEITHENMASGRTISVSFDGSNEATVTGPRGGTVQVPLVCGP
jgi:hypothetical protein